MTLIEAVLALPLPVRLALLDADPTGPGWDIDADGTARVYESPNDRSLTTSVDVVRRHVAQGCAWLPSNPLAVIEVAARLLAQRHGLTPSIELLGPDGAEDEAPWTCRLVVTSGIKVEAAGSREEIGVLVLREVCRG